MPDDVVDAVRDLYNRGLCLQALKLAEKTAPLGQWRGTRARLYASRLAANCGSPRLGFALDWLAFRENPKDPEAIESEGRRLLHTRGPWFAMEFIWRHGDLADAPTEKRAWWLATQAAAAAAVRDFDSADRLIGQALKLSPADAWVRCEYVGILEQQDQYERALEMSDQALRLRPWYRPALQQRAHLLCLRDREQDACNLLEEATQHIENMWIVMQLSDLQRELQQFKASRANLEKVLTLAPLLEKKLAKWMAAKRSDLAYYCGDLPAAAALAREGDNPFHKQIVEKLENPDPAAKCARLPVPFVRQHHMTCAPATLAAISKYWNQPAEHLSIVEEICYDGTPAYSERTWATDHGYIAREFTVTFDSAVALMDRGIPFTLTTVAPTSAHLQAVIGYDSVRGTLLIRDPYLRHVGEFLIEGFLKHQQSTGPRGMILLPTDKAQLLDAIDLPDASLYDLFYQLNHALRQHLRADAEQQYGAMKQVDPHHRLTIWAERALAAYDADVPGMLRSIDKLLAMYPDDDFLQLSRLGFLRQLSRRDEILATLKRLSEKAKAEPVFLQQYANELSADAREHPRAKRLLRQALRRRPVEPSILYALAGVLWQDREFETALQLYRITSSLGDKDENYALSYFRAIRALRRGEDALDSLRNRFKRYGGKSSQPAMSLFTALAQMGRPDEGFAILDEALKQRPSDPDLLLFSADRHARHGMFDRADSLLEMAKGKARQTAYYRAAAVLASLRGDTPECLKLWQAVLEREPLAVDALQNVAGCTAEIEGRDRATLILFKAAERFPHHYDIHHLLVEWLRQGDDLETLEAAIAHLIEIHPADAWAQREMAIVKVRRGDVAGAAESARIAVGLEPTNAWSHNTMAWVQTAQGQIAEAGESCRQAIRLSADCDSAIRQLFDLHDDPQARREVLAFIKAELEKQVIFGQGLLTYRYLATAVLDDQQILEGLRQALEVRPDLWQAWTALARQLVDANQMEEALSLAKRATERFPMVSQLWLDLSNVHRLMQDRAGERQALERAAEINPGWSLPVRLLADQLVRCDELPRAREVAENTVKMFPLEAASHEQLAEVLWRMGERDAAIEKIGAALEIEAGNENWWGRLREWSRVVNRPTAAADLCRKLTQKRPGDARLWITLAQSLSGHEHLDERLAALDRAATLTPRDADPYDFRAVLLTEAGRYDEALAACRPPGWGDQSPLRLRGRAAWVEARRGNRELAIEQMTRIVEQDPKYAWGLSQLGDWYLQEKNYAKYVTIGEQLIKLNPHDSRSFGTLGHAYEQQKDRPKAKAAYQRALALDPGYRWGGMSLFDLQFEDQEFADAAKTLAQLQKHYQGDAYVAGRAVQLAFKIEEDVRECLKVLDHLCKTSGEDGQAVKWVCEYLWKNNVRKALETWLFNTCKSGKVNPMAGQFWADIVCARRKDFAAARKGIAELRAIGPEVDPQAAAAASVYVKQLAKAKKRWRMRSFIRGNREWLHRQNATWSALSYCYSHLNQHKNTVLWTDDWEQRPKVESWVVCNRVSALKWLKMEEQAVATSKRVITMEDGHLYPEPQLWIALADLMAGDAKAAAARVAGIRLPEKALEQDRFLSRLISLGADLTLARPTKKDAITRMAAVRRAFPTFNIDGPCRRAYLYVVDRIARTYGASVWPLMQRAQVQLARLQKKKD